MPYYSQEILEQFWVKSLSGSLSLQILSSFIHCFCSWKKQVKHMQIVLAFCGWMLRRNSTGSDEIHVGVTKSIRNILGVLRVIATLRYMVLSELSMRVEIWGVHCLKKIQRKVKTWEVKLCEAYSQRIKATSFLQPLYCLLPMLNCNITFF